MRSLKSMLTAINEAIEGRPISPIRPTSLYEAGRVGAAPGERMTRREAPPAAWFESGAEPTAEERTSRRERSGPARRRTVAEAPEETTLAAQRIRATLRNPESLRTAILLREVLDPPVSRRPRRTGRR